MKPTKVTVSKDPARTQIGTSADFPEGEGRCVNIGQTKLAVFRHNGELGCLKNQCLHSGGPLAEGTVKDGRVYCPWHEWDWDFQTGAGSGEENVGSYKIWEEGGVVYVDVSQPLQPKKVAPAHESVRITPNAKRTDGPIRILGISTTMMNAEHPRHSTSEWVLKEALAATAKRDNTETKFLALRDLKIRACEGYYSKDKGACVWPCSITQADPDDQMVEVYRGLVEWCDVVVVATPIRWNSASSLYYKMQERLNTVQNQITLHNKVLIQNKAACLIITGGQDGVQAVAGQMMMFFAELGFQFPQFPFVGWSRGWYNEEMKTNYADVQQSDVVEESVAMVDRAIRLAETFRTGHESGSHKRHK